MPEFRHTRLPNGLDVIGEINPDALSVGIGYFVKTGARDETAELSGCTHFLEHMMFKGTGRRTTFDINREFDEIGADPNAYTSNEATVYYGTVLPEFLPRAVDLLSDMMRPALRQKDFDDEKQVILNEIAMYLDQPDFDVFDRAMTAYFGDHPLGQSVLGTRESITALTRDQMMEYFRRRYSAGNITVAAAGNFDFDLLVEEVRRTAGHWEAGTPPRARPAARGTGRTIALARDPAKVSREHVAMLCSGPADQDPLRFAADILAAVIGDRTGSRLYWALVDRGVVEDASMGHRGFDGTGVFEIYVNADPDNVGEALSTVRRILDDVQERGVTTAELELAKTKHASSEVIAGETPRGRLFPCGGNWMYRGEYRSVADDLAAIRAVTLDDIRTVLDRRPFDDLTTVALGPLEKLPG